MTDFPSSNDTVATATNLGYFSRYSPAGKTSTKRFDSVDTLPPTSTDRLDYFTFRHSKGLQKVSITLTIEPSQNPIFFQELSVGLIRGFAAGQTAVEGIIQVGGQPPFGNQSFFHTSSKTFTFNVSSNSTKTVFAFMGTHQVGLAFDFIDLEYSFTFRISKETDLRDKIVGTGSSDTLIGTGSEDLIIGRSGNDVLRGRGSHDELKGDGGNDRLFGDSGHDELIGSSGNDNMNGGGGNDILRGGSGNDTMNGGSGKDELFGGGGKDNMKGGSGKDELRGGGGDDVMRGGGSADTLLGQGGDDRIFGDSGNDLIQGGTGNDILRGGSGNDTIYGQSGNDKLFGDSNDDTLIGGSGNDTIRGGTGDDVILGGTGINQLFGDLGADEFYLAAPGTGLQHLRDFHTSFDGEGIDKIVIDQSLFPTIANNTGGALDVILGQNFNFGVGADPSVFANNVLYTFNYDAAANTIDLYFKDDTGTSILIAVVNEGVSFDDFLVVA